MSDELLKIGLLGRGTGGAAFAELVEERADEGARSTVRRPVICGALIGGCMAFLWFNSHPAEVFMGDTGSLALGGVIGVMAFMIHQPFTLVIVGGIFVWELLSVVLQVGWFKYTRQRFGTGRRLFLMAPIHHHFQKKGWPETKVVIRFWVLSIGCALAGLATLKLR